MNSLVLDLQNCHGIRSLQCTLDFHGKSAIAIYAPNGTMKTSFAKTMKDLATSDETKDAVFPDRVTVRRIEDEAGKVLDPGNLVVVLSYDEDLGPTETTSTLLVNPALRKEYEGIQKALIKARDNLIGAVKTQGQIRGRQNVEFLISRAFTKEDNKFFIALKRISDEISKMEDAPFALVPYELLFNDKLREIFDRPDFKAALADYVTRLNVLLDKSKFFSRDNFSYYNAENVTKSLDGNGFFKAKHLLVLKGKDGTSVEITSPTELAEQVDKEKQEITDDNELRRKLDAIEKLLEKNEQTRAFFNYVASNVQLLPELGNMPAFEDKLWMSYLKAQQPLFDEAVRQWSDSEAREEEVQRQATAEQTQWESVIDIFNDRFFVPFRLTAKNKEKVILGQDQVLKLGFEFEDGPDRVSIDKKEDLLEVLSNGEKKAFYILNVLFEVETRKNSTDSTLFVIDDLADSFDYKNKYAIVQYLNEMTEQSSFKLILLTHNFDFFRTLNSRGVVAYDNCFTAQKSSSTIELAKATGIKNPFIKDFKPHFFDDPMKRVASLPFIRNIIEYTSGETDPGYLKLTLLLHWKPDSRSVSNADLDAVFNSVFGGSGAYAAAPDAVVDLILAQADIAAAAPEGINFENKIVLSMAIRLLAEKHMTEGISDPAFLAQVAENQTHRLHKEYLARNLGTVKQRKTLDLVILMTPENLHINAFMYEPIIDMTDEHLKRLLGEVKALSRAGAA